jgi:hypothetical protein
MCHNINDQTGDFDLLMSPHETFFRRLAVIEAGKIVVAWKQKRSLSDEVGRDCQRSPVKTTKKALWFVKVGMHMFLDRRSSIIIFKKSIVLLRRIWRSIVMYIAILGQYRDERESPRL